MTGDQALRAARAACGRHDWAAARQGFRAAGELGTQDLGSLATACWWLGEVEENAVATAELHRQFMGLGRPVEAALAAFELGYTEVVRGREDVGVGWMARARRLLQEQPEAPEWGFVLVADAQQALVEGDLDTAGGLAREALAIGERHGLSNGGRRWPASSAGAWLCTRGGLPKDCVTLTRRCCRCRPGGRPRVGGVALLRHDVAVLRAPGPSPGPALDHADRTLAQGSHPGGDVPPGSAGSIGPSCGSCTGNGFVLRWRLGRRRQTRSPWTSRSRERRTTASARCTGFGATSWPRRR